MLQKKAVRVGPQLFIVECADLDNDSIMFFDGEVWTGDIDGPNLLCTLVEVAEDLVASPSTTRWELQLSSNLWLRLASAIKDWHEEFAEVNE